MKNKIVLSEWYGFFGNNLEQIAGAILFAKCSDGETQLVFPNYKPTLAPKVSLPGSGRYGDTLKIEWFKNNSLYFNKKYDYNVKNFLSLVWNKNCYLTPASGHVNSDYENIVTNNLIEVYRKDIKPLILNSNISNVSLFSKKLSKYKINENTLTIHLRGNDVIKIDHPLYQQKNVPWSYYKNILESNNYERIILCKDDSSNPNYNQIIDFCKSNNVEVYDNQRSLSEDFFILLNSYNILSSGYSSFSFTSGYMNDKLINFYYPISKSPSPKETIRLNCLETSQSKVYKYTVL
jgi:hypothetical protein